MKYFKCTLSGAMAVIQRFNFCHNHSKEPCKSSCPCLGKSNFLTVAALLPFPADRTKPIYYLPSWLMITLWLSQYCNVLTGFRRLHYLTAISIHHLLLCSILWNSFTIISFAVKLFQLCIGSICKQTKSFRMNLSAWDHPFNASGSMPFSYLSHLT